MCVENNNEKNANNPLVVNGWREKHKKWNIISLDSV